jgi:hypothetical protein
MHLGEVVDARKGIDIAFNGARLDYIKLSESTLI